MIETPIWKLRLLSDYGLSAPDGAPITLSTRKSLALLAYLARQPGRQAPRERLASLLWEDAAPQQARLNLRKALSSLRQESRLADHPEASLIEADNDAVWLVEGALSSDVDALERAAAQDGPAETARVGDLYTGDFLSDFALRGAPAFDAWAQVERQRLRELAITALTAAMEQRLLPGSAPEGGVVAAMQLLALDPLQERAHRALMRLYARQGRRSAALKQFHALSELLARELNTTPEAETRELFREISAARHARAPDPAQASPPVEPPRHGPEEDLGSLSEAHPRRRRRTAIAAAAILSLAAAGGAVVLVSRSPQLASLWPVARERSIAVLPFAALGDQVETVQFADGLTDEVTDSLVQYPELRVSGRTSAFQFRNKEVDLKEVGPSLGVDYVVKGSVRRDGERLRVTAQLLEVASGFAVWSSTYDRRASEAYFIQDDVARNIARELKAGPGERTRSARAPNGRAYQLYLVATANLHTGGKAEAATAQKLFEHQLALDPNDPRALAGYAQATISLAQQFALPFEEARESSETAIARALLIDPGCADAYLARSQIEALAARWTNQPGHGALALDAAKRAVDLAPRNADALSSYGFHLINNARSDEAIEVLQRAIELDPLHRRAQAQLGKAYRSAGLLDRAARQYRTTVELFPDYADANILLGQAMYERGDVVAAERAYLDAARISPNPSAAINRATLYANLQMNDEASAQLASIRTPPMFSAFSRALARHLAGDYRGAMALAEAEVARDPDSPLRDIIFADAAILGDHAKARRHLAELAPGTLSAEPDFPAAALDSAIIGAHVLNHTGEEAQASKVLARILTLASVRPGRDSQPLQWWARINAYAELGQYERALAELRKAIDAGFHDRVDDSILVRLEDWPSLHPLRGDARFQQMIAQIEARNRNLRGKLIAARSKAA